LGQRNAAAFAALRVHYPGARQQLNNFRQVMLGNRGFLGELPNGDAVILVSGDDDNRSEGVFRGLR
jgi:hypothetical protein